MPESSQVAPWVATALTLLVAGGVGLAGTYHWLIKPSASLGLISETSAQICIWTLVGLFLLMSACIVGKEIKKEKAAQ